jgi:hypothetical protein
MQVDSSKPTNQVAERHRRPREASSALILIDNVDAIAGNRVALGVHKHKGRGAAANAELGFEFVLCK